MIKPRLIVFFVFIASLIGCDFGQSDRGQLNSDQLNPGQLNNASSLPRISQPSALAPVKRVTDKVILDKGHALYIKNCSQCHGGQAQGTKEWRQPDADGKYPPPPLNGTAHAWHHPTEVLMEVMKDGTLPDGNMPAWEGKLTDEELLSVIAWFQSLWSEEIFKTWSQLDQESRED